MYHEHPRTGGRGGRRSMERLGPRLTYMTTAASLHAETSWSLWKAEFMMVGMLIARKIMEMVSTRAIAGAALGLSERRIKTVKSAIPAMAACDQVGVNRLLS